MIQGYSPMVQTLLGTLFTWGLTAAGAALVVVIRGKQRKLLDTSLGFAGGVMIAASYWSLLAPAIEMAEESKNYGEDGEYAVVPIAIGFLLGCLFVFIADVVISQYGLHSPSFMLAAHPEYVLNISISEQSTITSEMQVFHSNKVIETSQLNAEFPLSLNNKDSVLALNDQITQEKKYELSSQSYFEDPNNLVSVHSTIEDMCGDNAFGVTKRRKLTADLPGCTLEGGAGAAGGGGVATEAAGAGAGVDTRWKRVLLLLIAITVHNIPEGMVVGVGFAATISSPSATFQNARNLAIGIGIQNFPEGLAVSLPLQAAGYSTWTSFWFGQLSGMVEPVFGILGALAVTMAKPLLPYALSFAAGAMVYVVFDDIVPEAHASGNGRLATWGAIVGFITMMSLDVGLG
ncbi:hypothetical protein LSTR_LSTR011205 [Laodelphax striatellus]|uniref:Zinc transporter ZIP11 n=1 Tax=Laodelphax striatellus TaxID=195883 RepID=A0A482WMX5_LAOST|nr:hypothetical protein LSTR_LSTR011205 [Laodelphax striatellus]